MFRPVVPSDVPVLLGYMADLYAQDRIPFISARASTALAALIQDSALGRAIALEVNGALVGYLIVTFGYSLEYGGRDAFIDELYVSASFRGQGLGTAALSHAADLCRALGIKALHLEVDHANTEAHALYTRLGFEAHERHLMTRRL